MNLESAPSSRLSESGRSRAKVWAHVARVITIDLALYVHQARAGWMDLTIGQHLSAAGPVEPRVNRADASVAQTESAAKANLDKRSEANSSLDYKFVKKLVVAARDVYDGRVHNTKHVRPNHDVEYGDD